MLLAFYPLRFSWSGSGELATLLKAEWQGGAFPLRGQALICAFYLNELLLRLLPRNDPHEGLYDAYATALHRLADASHLSVILRQFEKKLLEELGYAMVLIREAGGDLPVQPDRRYLYDPEAGPVKLAHPDPDVLTVSGQTLLDIEREDFSRAETREESRLLMRNLIGHRLGERPLHSRTILRELQEL
jgi:DNA repair protein RecO (recombination protein O)